MPSPQERDFRDDYYRDIADTGRAGSALTKRFTQGISQFSPQMAFEKRLRSAHDQFRERFDRDLTTLRSTQTGMGRLNTGFATKDEDRLFTDLGSDLNRQIGSFALQTSGQELDALGLLGSHADRVSDRAMSARGGEYHTLRAQRLQEDRERRERKGGLLQSLLTVGGGLLGSIFAPGIGTAAGAAAGRSAGRRMGGQ